MCIWEDTCSLIYAILYDVMSKNELITLYVFLLSVVYLYLSPLQLSATRCVTLAVEISLRTLPPMFWIRTKFRRISSCKFKIYSGDLNTGNIWVPNFLKFRFQMVRYSNVSIWAMSYVLYWPFKYRTST